MTTTFRAHPFLSAIAALALALAVAPHVHAADDAQADALFHKGREAAARKDWTAARAAYAQAFSIKQSYDIAANLGQAEYKLGMYRDAAEHLDYALRHFPAAIEADEVRVRIQQALDDAKRQIVTVRLAVDKPHASIAIDGRPVGQSPLPGELYVEPGTHTIEATLVGHRPAQADVAASAGEQLSVQLAMQPEATPPPAAVPVAPAPAPTSTPTPGPTSSPTAASSSALFTTQDLPQHDRAGSRSIWPLVIGGSATAALLGGGIVLRVLSAQKSEQADALSADISLTAHRCNDVPRPTKCGELQDKLEAKDTLQNWSTVAFVAAGAAAVGTVTAYLLWPRSDAPRVGLAVTPDATAFTLEHLF